jgi:hypothetical protein
MSNESIQELWRQHRFGQDKYTYFLLAVSASAIAFAVQKTEGLQLSTDLCLVGGAVLVWGLSFYCGCQNLVWVQTSLYANFSLVQLQTGTHPQQPEHPQLVAAAVDGVRSATESNISKAQLHAIWQFRLLILGALLFIGWHTWRIYLNGHA